MNKIFLRFPLQRQILFAKRLSLLIRAGVPILQGLQMLNKQADSRSSAQIYKALISDVESGQFLYAGLEKFGKLFGEFAVNIVRVGEISGTLHQNLDYLAEELKKKQALRRKILSAMVYPVFIIIATFGITILLTVYIFPKILPIFASLNFKLPWTTSALIFVSNLFTRHGWYILLGLLVLVVGFILLMRIKRVRFFMDHVVLRVPIVGQLAKAYHMANFTRTLGLLLKSDVMIVEATNITANSTTNLAYRKELHAIADNMTKGEKISTHLDRKAKMFPPILSQMVTVGEATGNLSDTLIFLSEMYEDEVDELTKNLSNVLEPALMVFMGIIVGFLAISIITPIYEVTQNIHP